MPSRFVFLFLASIVALFFLAGLWHVSQAAAIQEEPASNTPSSQVEIRSWITAQTVNFRRGPGVDHDVIRVLAANEPVRVLERAGRWVRVEWVPREGGAIQGWISGRYLSENSLPPQEEDEKPGSRSENSHSVGILAVLCLGAVAAIYLARHILPGKPVRRSLIPPALRETRPHETDPLRLHHARPGPTGKAYVVDGDTIMVANERIRLAQIDAPELDQVGFDKTRMETNQGYDVRGELMDKLEGKRVEVTLLPWNKRNGNFRDRNGRLLGIVTCGGEDIGEWLVRKGLAVAAFGARYKAEEEEATAAGRGMWGYEGRMRPSRWRKLSKAEKDRFVQAHRQALRKF